MTEKKDAFTMKSYFWAHDHELFLKAVFKFASKPLTLNKSIKKLPLSEMKFNVSSTKFADNIKFHSGKY